MPEFDEESMKRISNTVRLVEAFPRSDLPVDRGPRMLQSSKFAKTTTFVGPGNITTLGSGKATLLFLSVDSTGVGHLMPQTMADVTVYNGGSSVATGRLVQIKVIDGQWVIDVDYCP